MTTKTSGAYSNITKAINDGVDLNKDLFSYYIEAVNGESLFELSETELSILEFIRSQGRKVSLSLVLHQENPKTGQTIKKFTPNEKISTDLIAYKHTPFQYVVSIQ